MAIAMVHVKNSPFSQDEVWDGKRWDEQNARCSNNFLSGPTPPVPPASAAAGLIWKIHGLEDPSTVIFNVSVALPDLEDEGVFVGLRHNSETTYLPLPSVTGYQDPQGCRIPEHHSGNSAILWSTYYSMGIYIASVHGAKQPFMLEVSGYVTVATAGTAILQALLAGASTAYSRVRA